MFCYDADVIHSLATILGTWLIMRLAPRKWVGVVSFVFNLGYLLAAYYHVSSADNYDIDFTMLQCVLTLRLIGLAYDYADGGLPEGKVSEYQRANRLVALPDLLEVLGHSYHWAGLLVGPQYSMATYRRFLNGDERMPPTWLPAICTFLLGAGYMAAHFALGAYFPTSAVLTDEFRSAWPLWQRVGYMVVAYRVLLMRYAAIWLISDGHCILSGLGYAGLDHLSRHRWNNVSNFLPLRFATASSIGDYVGSFNVNTNNWVKEYVFKRLRFLNNRNLSSLGSLVFLAVWHGLAPGYFMTFVLEFVDGIAEGALVRLTKPLSAWAATNPVAAALHRVAACAIATAMLSYGLVSFDLKDYARAVEVYSALLWVGHIIPVVLILLDGIAGLFRRPKARGEGKAKAA